MPRKKRKNRKQLLALEQCTESLRVIEINARLTRKALKRVRPLLLSLALSQTLRGQQEN